MQVKLEKVDPAVERCAHISAIVGRLGRPRRVRSEMPEFDVLRACVCGPGSEGPVQSKLPQERNGWVRLSGTTLHLKRLVSSQIVLWMPCQTALSAHERSRMRSSLVLQR